MSFKLTNSEEVLTIARRKSSFIERAIDRLVLPTYHPTNKHWEITFSALGWKRETIEKFWSLFYTINYSHSGEITPFEFFNYLDLERSTYVEKCFEYFDTTGGETIDFLEFMISVWNICTLKVETLTNFTFDIYDLDSDGELSLPEIERLVQEVYGKEASSKGLDKGVLADISNFAEERGGSLDLTAFTIYTTNHSMLLFPIFKIQRAIQTKVFGLKYWEDVERNRSEYTNPDDGKVFDPRHVQILLRTYQTGAAAAVLEHTGDPNVALKEWFDKTSDDIDSPRPKHEESNKNDKDDINYSSSRWMKVRDIVLKGTLSKATSRSAEDKKEKERKIEMATKAFMDAGAKYKSIIAKGLKSNVYSKKNEKKGSIEGKSNLPVQSEYVTEEENEKVSANDLGVGSVHSSKIRFHEDEKTNIRSYASADSNNVPVQNSSSDATQQTKELDRNSSLEINDLTQKSNFDSRYLMRSKTRMNKLSKRLNGGSAPKMRIDKKDSVKSNDMGSRPRTPGRIVYTISNDGESFHSDVNTITSKDISKMFNIS